MKHLRKRYHEIMFLYHEFLDMTGDPLEYSGHKFRVKRVSRASLIKLELWRKELEKASWPKRSISWRQDVLDNHRTRCGE